MDWICEIDGVFPFVGYDQIDSFALRVLHQLLLKRLLEIYIAMIINPDDGSFFLEIRQRNTISIFED